MTTPIGPNEVPIASISIPSIGLKDIPVYERGLDLGHRMLVAGGLSVTRYSHSSPLGGMSNTVLYGHNDIEGGVFARLSEASDGSQISVRLWSGSVQFYRVRGGSAVVPPTEVSILAPTAAPQLTLFSCYPVNVDDHRVVVVADPVAATP